MLTLTEKKRAKGRKKIKHEKVQKKALVTNVEEKDDTMMQIHELMPVPYKPEDHEAALGTTEVTFEQATITEQDCQTMTIPCMDASNSNKYVIITLLEPDAQGLTGEELLNAEITTADNDKKIQKKVILLHKIDTQTTATLPTIEATSSTATTVSMVKEEKNEFNDPLMTIDFSDFTSSTADTNDQKDLGNWVKSFPTLTLQYTESGKPYVKCPACTALFFKACTFEKHVSCHLRKHGDSYVCVFCKYNNEDASTIFDHLNIHQDQCEICNINLTRKNYFKKHSEISELAMNLTVKRDRWGRFICIYCRLGFDLYHQLQKHWFKHSCNEKKISQCKYCSGLFDTDEALQNHVCLKCPVCEKTYDSVHRLRSHTRYEKHYLYCQICSYEFILAVDHEKHMALHKKTFVTHKDYAHCLESEDKTSFACALCGKIYHTMSILVLHIHDDHKIESRPLTEEELARLSLPDVGKCEVDFQEVLNAQAEMR
ncbi:zinc finger and BTB domain-containing protein 17-like [Copidosoma floridanum]|uniref:zinc finger and BTB domain-containing protein 17-like n=1 Tax=Copidosoma floridanum TaxID=29053 RepID=UPI0006C97D86|nr:zinc finger and BTB domain-containing protein 17-like [Copidosoma floridanum]